ncbi:hypothetical protein FQZ97_965400 [compost metagenome]
MSVKTNPTKRSAHKRVASSVSVDDMRSTFRQQRIPQSISLEPRRCHRQASASHTRYVAPDLRVHTRRFLPL